MTEETSYEFADFQLNPVRRQLLRNGESTQLPTKAFDLLLQLIRAKGKPLSKELLWKKVWGTTFVSDNTFHVTLHAVRKALDDPAERQRYIRKVSLGYCFVGDIREVAASVPSQPIVEQPALSSDQRYIGTVLTTRLAPFNRPLASRTIVHLAVSCSLYAALYAVSVFLELAYEFDRYGLIAWKLAPLTFVWIIFTSGAGIAADRKLTLQGKPLGLAAAVATFLLAAALLFILLSHWLPSFPITQLTLQSYPAQAAYLKDTSYFLILAFCFLLVPFHFIAAVEREIERGQCGQVMGLLSGNKLSTSPKGTIYPRFWALASLLVVLAAFSLVMTSRLLDHLKPAPYMNLFTLLVYVRAFLYFGLGIEGLIWYYRSIDEIKRECLIQR